MLTNALLRRALIYTLGGEETGVSEWDTGTNQNKSLSGELGVPRALTHTAGVGIMRRDTQGLTRKETRLKITN